MSADVFNRILNIFFFQPVEVDIPSGEADACAYSDRICTCCDSAWKCICSLHVTVVLLADSFVHAQQIRFRMGGVVMSTVTSHQEGYGLKSPGTSLCGVHQVFLCLRLGGWLYIMDLQRAGYQSIPSPKGVGCEKGSLSLRWHAH